jgi:phospholipid-binding lipoprotein MlaA
MSRPDRLCRAIGLLGLILAPLALPGTAAAAPTPLPPPAPADKAQLEAGPMEDPLEPINRRMFRIDLWINRVLAGKGRLIFTARWIPSQVREGLYNAFDNLDEPATAANDVLQAKPKRSALTVARFGVNSTIGVLGVFDVASKMGLKRSREDFGQTLAMWGITAGPYVYIPITGPSTARDELAGFVDNLFLPGHWFPETTYERHGLHILNVIVQPSTIGIRQVARGAAEAGDTKDEYATLRQLYYDQRADQIADRPNLADNPVAAFPEKKKKPKPDAAPPPAAPQ